MSRRSRCGGGCCSSARRGSCAAGRSRPPRRPTGAGYGSLAAFSRAFARAYGTPPSAFDGEVQLEAPNGIHFHPPAGLLIPGTREPVARRDLTRPDRLASPRPRARAAGGGGDARPRGARARAAARLRGRLVRGRGGERGADGGAAGVHARGLGRGDRRASRCRRRRRAAAAALRARRARLRAAREAIRDRGAFDDAFVDALCEPPQSFTYGGVLAHVLSFGAIRREALASVLASSARTCRRPAIRSCGSRLRARGSGWPGTRRRPERRRAPAGRCSRCAGVSRVAVDALAVAVDGVALALDADRQRRPRVRRLRARRAASRSAKP